jgi:pilus assembly protein CpaB
MSSTALKIIAVVAVLLAVILAAVGYNYSRGFVEQAEKAEKAEQQRAQEKPQTLAVVALKPLAAYKPIAKEDVALVPVAVLPASPYTSLDQVAGKVPLVDVDAGAPVTARYFADSNILARAIPEGFQAISVEVNDVIAVGGFVRPGDVVDVLLFLRGTGDVPQAQSRVLLKDVRVLAYEERIIDRPEGVEDGKDQQRSRQRTAVLAVPEADTTKLMLGVNAGELRLALHAQKSEVETAQVETTDNGLPLSAEALAKEKAKEARGKAVGITELAKIKSGGHSGGGGRTAPTGPTVEIVRGTSVQTSSAK